VLRSRKNRSKEQTVLVFSNFECSNLTRMYSSVDMISIRLSYFKFKEMNHANKFRELLFKYQQVRFRLAILSQIKKENGTGAQPVCFIFFLKKREWHSLLNVFIWWESIMFSVECLKIWCKCDVKEIFDELIHAVHTHACSKLDTYWNGKWKKNKHHTHADSPWFR